MTSIKAQLQGITDSQLAKETLLRDYLSPGQSVYTISRGSSASGMTHYYSIAVGGVDYAGNSDIFNITYYAAAALGYKLVDRAGHRVIKVQGGGMDMGFHLVYELSTVLYSGADRAGYVLKHRGI